MGEATAPFDLIRGQSIAVKIGRRFLLYPMDIEMKPGQWIGVVGPNGAGKSTLLKAIAGLMPAEGKLFWRGQTLGSDRIGFRKQLGVLLHEPLLYPEMTASENLLFYARLYGVEQPQQAIERQLQAVGLTLFAHERVGQFSKGMTQRLALARALLHDPALLLLDEPLASLDARGASDVLALFRQAKESGIAAIWVTHRWEMAWPLIDQFIELDRGRVIGVSDTDELTLETWSPQHVDAADDSKQ